MNFKSQKKILIESWIIKGKNKTDTNQI
ncbi:hypothetical protein OIU77_011463 [Salix suchowensis]|uniref:Uncharacterized protein n=1 Tax=Salix suchowensis TaxID=1278906 RepID=A0ABQ9A1B6_9ROSI|nr:hypothetical protein OIU77_011463 [Salix suchowensis]